MTGNCDFAFGLWDSAIGGAQVGGTQPVNSLAVNDGYFTAPLNAGNEFGGSAFNGQARWLAIDPRAWFDR